MLRALAGGILALFGAATAAGQDDVPTDFSIFGWEAPQIVEPYMADRATFTPRARVVPQGRFIISAGTTYTYNDDNDVEVQNWTGPELKIQSGILPRVNFNVSWDGYSVTEIDTTGFSDTSSGNTDLDIELKVQVLETERFLPGLAVFGGASLPVGSDDLTSDRVDPNLGLSLWWDDFDDVWQVFGSARFTLLEDGTNEEFVQSTVSGGTAQKWTNGVTTFIEYFGFLNDNDTVNDAHFLQTGGIFEVAPNATVDFRFGVGLSDDSADLFFGFGGSVSL